MPAKIYWLHNFEYMSRLGIMPRPRGNEWLEEDILSLKRQGVQIIISLLDIVIHCRIGIGRSTIIAGCLLLKPGYKTDEFITHVSKIRGMRVPDTDEQIAWLKKQE